VSLAAWQTYYGAYFLDLIKEIKLRGAQRGAASVLFDQPGPPTIANDPRALAFTAVRRVSFVRRLAPPRMAWLVLDEVGAALDPVSRTPGHDWHGGGRVLR
jgi:hypothetical protein